MLIWRTLTQGSALACAVLAAALCFFRPGVAGAQVTAQLLWSVQANGNMQAIISTPDIDGDGGPDVVFEGYGNGPSGVTHVFAVRGGSSGVGQILWAVQPIGGASSGGGYGGNCLRLGADLTSDGFPEVLLGTAWGGRTAYALNGKTGATFWSFDTYVHDGSSNSGWIYAMDNLGSDLTGDGIPEVVFCSGSYNDRVHCVNGANGNQVWVYYGGDAFLDILSCQDINGDGVRDVVAALGDNDVSPRVIALSGRTGSVLWQCPVQGTVWNLAFISDLNGDGIDEIVPAQWGSSLYGINGRTGAVIWTSPVNNQQRVVALDDVNGDGVRDIAVGFNSSAFCRVCSGANGAILWTTPTSDWTWAVDRVGDCTGDGINDVAVGDFDGKVYLLDGVTGQVFWSWLNPTGDKIMTIHGAPDLNASGFPDVVAGSQLLYGGSGGWVYALEGNGNAAALPPGRPVFDGLRLSETFPNPSSGGMNWSLSLGRAAGARLLLIAPDGRRIRDLGERAMLAGTERRIFWDGCDDRGLPVPSGIYLMRLLADGRPVGERRAVIIR